MKEQGNMAFYNALRSVPQVAMKTIQGGRLKGMTDINPMWRIQVMTETFGACGIGWRYEITSQWHEVIGQEQKAFCNINLYVKVGGEWSDAIPGTGGATMYEVGKSGSYFNDECYKMALTDALSVAMKALGVAADVYFVNGATYGTKYEQPASKPQSTKATTSATAKKPQPATTNQQQPAQQDVAEYLEYYIKPALQQARTKEDLKKIYSDNMQLATNQTFLELCGARRKELGV